jgi:hypothetical protein
MKAGGMMWLRGRSTFMILEKKRGLGVFTLVFLMWFSYPCLADEILFQDQKAPQTGTIVNEDAQSVTIRFSRESIKSIRKSPEEASPALPGKVIWEEKGDYLILKIPRAAIQIESYETPANASSKKPGSAASGVLPTQDKSAPPEKSSGAAEPAKVSQVSQTSKNDATHEKMLLEEMGGVQGIIVWQGKPLGNGKVRIELETYTGFSIAAVKHMLGIGKEEATAQEVSFETQTDSQGRYSFPRVPPGYYRLYWLPDPQTGWVRRLREKPDFEVVPGNVIVQNIPGKKK